MPKLLNRLLVILLIPCLTTDPTSAVALSFSGSTEGYNQTRRPHIDCFQTEALELRALWEHRVMDDVPHASDVRALATFATVEVGTGASEPDEMTIERPAGLPAMGLERLRQTGVSGWDEFFDAAHVGPGKLQRLYVDLDDTLFRPAGYVGSEAWFRDERAAYRLRYASLRRQKNIEERRLLQIPGGLVEAEPALAAKLRELQSRGVQIIGLTARDLSAQDQTQKALSRLGFNIPVHYAGRYRSKLEFVRQDLERQPLQSGEVGALVDDRLDIFVTPEQSIGLAEKGIYTIAYRRKPAYSLTQSLQALHQAEAAGRHIQAIAHAIDTLILAKGHDQEGDRVQRSAVQEAVERANFYRAINTFVERSHDDRLTMAYVESISNYLSRGLENNLPESLRREVVDSLTHKIAPYNAAALTEAILDHRVAIRRFQPVYGAQVMESRYEIVLDEKNVYVLMEPVLRYLRQAKPPLVVFPDTGARPLKAMVDSVLRKEGLAGQVQTLLLPVSRNRAGDSLFEMRRWLDLMRHPENAQTDEDRQLAAMGRGVDWDKLEGAGIAVVDDNITSGGTVELIEQVFKREAGVTGVVGLTPFSYSAGEGLSFGMVGTIVLAGSHRWTTEVSHGSPPLVVTMPWEADKVKRGWYGARSRRPFELPRAAAADVALRSMEAQRLQSALEAGYSTDDQAMALRETIQATTPSRSGTEPSGPEPGVPGSITPMGQGLPDELMLGNFALVRVTGEVPAWITDENLITRQDAAMLVHPDTRSGTELTLYEVRDAQGQSIGVVLCANAFNVDLDLSLVIRKIAPRRGTTWDPVEVVEILKTFVADNEATLAIRGVYMNTSSARMAPLSESHPVRSTLLAGFGYYPLQRLELQIAEGLRDWVGPVNALWKRLTDREQSQRQEAREVLWTSGVYSDPNLGRLSPMARVILAAQQRLQLSRLRKLLADSVQVPLSPLDWRLVQWIASQDGLWSQPVPPGEQRKRTLRAVIDRIQQLPSTEEPPDLGDVLPALYHTPEGQREWENQLVAYFFHNYWDRGGDLSNLSRADFQDRGFLWLWQALGGETLKVLDRLTEPGVYVRQDNGEIAINSRRPVTERQFQRYLEGAWWTVAPGTRYTMTGREKLPSSERRQRGFPTGTLEFSDDPGLGTIGKNLSARSGSQHWIAGGTSGAVIYGTRSPDEDQARLGLTVAKWIENKGEMGRKKLSEGFMRWHHAGSNGLISAGNVHFSSGVNKGKPVLGRLERDPAYGVVFAFYEEHHDGQGQRSLSLSQAYRFSGGKLEPLNNSGAAARTLAHWDFEAWEKSRGQVGDMALGREERWGEAPVRVIVGDKDFSTGVEKREAIIGRLERDSVHGVILVFYKETYKESGERVLIPTQAYRYRGGKPEPLNHRLMALHSLAYWDLSDWVENRGQIGDMMLGREERWSQAGARGLVKVGSQLLLTGIERGKPVMGRLEQDPVYGVVLAFYEEDHNERGERVLTLTQAYKHKGNELQSPLNDRRAAGRSLAYWDIENWVKSHSEVGNMMLGREERWSKVGKKGRVYVLGQNFATGLEEGNPVMGRLERDPVHGVMLAFYEEGRDESGERALKLTQAHRYKADKSQALNQGGSEGRSPVYWDLADWVTSEGQVGDMMLGREVFWSKAGYKGQINVGIRTFTSGVDGDNPVIIRLERHEPSGDVHLVFYHVLEDGTRGSESRRYTPDAINRRDKLHNHSSRASAKSA